MSESERVHWEERYATEGARNADPATFLREIADRLPPGSKILDVGGGSGRNAIWLAERGHQVTVADIAEGALAMTREAAGAANVDVKTVLTDFDADRFPTGPWDVIIDFHFLKRHLFPRFRDSLGPGGLLVFCQATVRNLERHQRPPRPYLLDQGEGWALLSDFELLVAREEWSSEDRHEFECLARLSSAEPSK